MAGNVAADPRAVSTRGWDRATLEAGRDGYTVLRALRDAAVITDWLVVDANALVRERWSWVVGDIIGKRSSELNAAADNSLLHPVFEAAVATGEPQHIEFELSVPGGRGGWRQLLVTPVDRDTVSVITRDISRERELEDALVRERKRTAGQREVARSNIALDPATEARFAGRSAAALFFGSGLAAFVNSWVGRLDGVNVGALRLVGCASALFAAAVLLLPWARYQRALSIGLIAVAIAFLFTSEHIDYYSRSPAALAVYPVFFILLVAWSGLVLPRVTATIVALIAAPVLYGMLSHGGHSSVGWQCVIVTLPVAAVLGEVLSWNVHRARTMTMLELQRRLHDPLTGLANRTLLAIQIDGALARVRRGHNAIALLYVDVDHFKSVNDTLGHHAGDDLLTGIAAHLQRNTRETDTVARIGGDEFIVLCEDIANAQGAIDIAKRLLTIDDCELCTDVAGRPITLSIGIALSQDGLETEETLLQNADLALYRAKDEGRARYELFGDELRHQVTVRRELEEALRHSIERDELRIYFQPIIDGETANVTSFESLVRWERPGYGLVPPGEFVPIAEETGLIVDIGAWVIQKATLAAAEWSRRWSRPLGVSVNISPHQLTSNDVVNTVRSALVTSRLDPHLLTLELTESTLIERVHDAEPQLRALRALGVKIAIDDFGVGYSSLTYLRKFPIDTVKIDQSFVRAIGTEREDTAIVAAIIGLARNLDMNVVAEGVETPEQLATLLQLNCAQLQGFLFSRPVPGAELGALLRREANWLESEARA